MESQMNGDELQSNLASSKPAPYLGWEQPGASNRPVRSEKGADNGRVPVGSHTARVCELVDQVLRQFSAPYPADIIDQVAGAIQDDLEWLSEYFLLVNAFSAHSQHSQTVVNDLLSMFVLLLTGMVETDENRPAQSHLLTNYTVLRHI
ncbi:MAG: hypothetical protein H6651_13380 [Ardenticatenales bacterium]|nr:hypothetical protein [Ardenticatenales bacterium]